MMLSNDGRSLSGEPIPYFKTTNRYTFGRAILKALPTST
jgi:hypothetical protein